MLMLLIATLYQLQSTSKIIFDIYLRNLLNLPMKLCLWETTAGKAAYRRFNLTVNSNTRVPESNERCAEGPLGSTVRNVLGLFLPADAPGGVN